MYNDVNPKYDKYSTDTDDKAINNSIKNLFISKMGSIPGKPYIGNKAFGALFDNIGTVEVNVLKTGFINLIENYEPRIQILSLEVQIDKIYHTINVIIEYVILESNINNIYLTKITLNQNDLSFIELRDIGH